MFRWQLGGCEATANQLRQQLRDQQELNEELEFRLFELEESSEMVRTLCSCCNSYLHFLAHYLALAASASQPLKSGTLSLYISVPVPVLILFVVTSRPTTASRPSNPLNASPPAPQIRLCWPLCAFIIYIYLLTYLFTSSSAARFPAACNVFNVSSPTAFGRNKHRPLKSVPLYTVSQSDHLYFFNNSVKNRPSGMSLTQRVLEEFSD